MGIKICPNCGGKVAESRNDCIHCGYIFPESKKCPDCEAELPLNATECPECGHIFPSVELNEKPDEKKDCLKESQTVDDNAQCPYCGSTESMKIGNNIFMCQVCRNRYVSLNKKASQTVNHQPLSAFSSNNEDGGNETQEEIDADSPVIIENPSTEITVETQEISEEAKEEIQMLENRIEDAKKLHKNPVKNIIAVAVPAYVLFMCLPFMISFYGEMGSFAWLIVTLTAVIPTVVCLIFVFFLIKRIKINKQCNRIIKECKIKIKELTQ